MIDPKRINAKLTAVVVASKEAHDDSMKVAASYARLSAVLADFIAELEHAGAEIAELSGEPEPAEQNTRGRH